MYLPSEAIACSAIQIVRAFGNPHIRPVYSATYVIQFFFSFTLYTMYEFTSVSFFTLYRFVSSLLLCLYHRDPLTPSFPSRTTAATTKSRGGKKPGTNIWIYGKCALYAVWVSMLHTQNYVRYKLQCFISFLLFIVIILEMVWMEIPSHSCRRDVRHAFNAKMPSAIFVGPKNVVNILDMRLFLYRYRTYNRGRFNDQCSSSKMNGSKWTRLDTEIGTNMKWEMAKRKKKCFRNLSNVSSKTNMQAYWSI